MAESVLIGIDVGTTTIKVAVFDTRGRALKSWAAAYPTFRHAPDSVEQNAQDWMEQVLAGLHTVSDGISPGGIAAVGLCSQVNSHVFVDGAGKALLPAFVWQDGRCAAVAAELDAKVPIADRIEWWGAPLPIDASHILARMEYVKRHHPAVWAKTRYVLAPKDYCILHLTGALAADPMTNFGLLDGTLKPITALIDLVDGASRRLPPIQRFSQVVGRIAQGLPAAGAMMVTGTMDAWAGMFGAGVCRTGEAFYLSGTSEILGLVSPERIPTPGVIAFAECEGIVLHAGPTQSGGASVHWLARLLGETPEGLSVLAQQVEKGTRRPLFLPHLQGERAPIWDINARGVFAGLDGSTGRAELARSVFEGVAYSARWLLDTLEQSGAMRPDALNHAGGGAGSDIWCQIRADVLGLPIRRVAYRDSGVLGAALLAGVGAGLYPDIATAAQSCVQLDRVFEPEQAQQQEQAARFAMFKSLYENVKPFNAAWAGI